MISISLNSYLVCSCIESSLCLRMPAAIKVPFRLCIKLGVLSHEKLMFVEWRKSYDRKSYVSADSRVSIGFMLVDMLAYALTNTLVKIRLVTFTQNHSSYLQLIHRLLFIRNCYSFLMSEEMMAFKVLVHFFFLGLW